MIRVPSRLAKFSPEENDQYNSDMRNEWDIANEKAFIKKEGHAEGVAEGFAQGIAKGKAEGREEGKAEGKAERNIEVAKALLANGIAVSVISTCTGLSEQEIKAL